MFLSVPKLKCGIEVKIEQYFVCGTYSSFLAGNPSRLLNDRAKASLLVRASAIWPNIPAYIMMDPSMDQTTEGISLPEITVMARFLCFDPARDPSKMASELVVLWFEEKHSNIFAYSIPKYLLDINWFEMAQDFDW